MKVEDFIYNQVFQSYLVLDSFNLNQKKNKAKEK